DDEPAGKAREEPIVQRVDLLRRPIAREDDLPAPRGERVPRPEQLLLHPGLTREELYVVENQEPDLAQAAPERVPLARLDRGGHAFHEVFEGVVDDLELGQD